MTRIHVPRDALIFRLESDGGTVGSSLTVREFMEQFLRYKEASDTIEPSTVMSYRGEAKQIYPALGAIRLAELTSADVDRWMAGITAEGYAPKTVAKPFRLLKQALKWAVGQAPGTWLPRPVFCQPALSGNRIAF